MGNLNPSRIPSDLAPLFEFMERTRRRLAELERFTLPDFTGQAEAAIQAAADHLEEDVALVLSTLASEVVARRLADDQEVIARNAAIAAAAASATGVLMTSPDGTKWRLGVSDAGTTTWTEVA